MTVTAIKYRRLIENLDKYDTVTEAMIQSGFSPQTARTQQKRTLRSALKWHADNAIHEAKSLASSDNVSAKRLAHEIVGLSQESLMGRLKSIAEQERDLASALKVLIPLAKQLGVDLTQEQQGTTIVPTLNISVKETKNGLTEPSIGTNPEVVAEYTLEDNEGAEE